MPNPYFQFKQFRIDQDRCAMKVTTEGCLLGALVVLHGNEKRILDIGTGTGLLSLMLAQRSEAVIDAVEMEHDAANQARRNFQRSPWKDRLYVTESHVQCFGGESNRIYDQIISNPPFFKGHLKSGKSKDRAIHNDELSMEDLTGSVARLLKPDGRFWVIYPAHEFDQFVEVAKTSELSLQLEYSIYDRPGKPIFRKIGVFAFRQKEHPDFKELFLKNSEGEYSLQFRELVKDYYLSL